MIYCELTEAEKDFYEALFKRSKVNLVFVSVLHLSLGLFTFDAAFLVYNCYVGICSGEV